MDLSNRGKNLLGEVNRNNGLDYILVYHKNLTFEDFVQCLFYFLFTYFSQMLYLIVYVLLFFAMISP